MTELSEALNGETEEVPAQPTDETVTETAEDTETVESTGEAEETAQESSPPEDNQVEAFKAKAIDETRKRQALEQQYQELLNRSATSETHQKKPDFWEDPDQALNGMAQQFHAELQRTRTDLSVEFMRSLHPDYDEKESIFVDAMQRNPALVTQMAQSANPAKFAYDYATTQLQMAEISNADAYRAKVEAELKPILEAKIEAETKARLEQEIQKRSELPGSLANERATGATSTHARPELEKLIG